MWQVPNFVALSFLLARARAKARARTQRNPAILLHSLRESSRKKVFECIGSIHFSPYICRRTSQKHRWTSIAPVSSSAPWLKLPKVRVAADSKLCCPLASFRPRRIPNLASLVAVPYDANLTVRSLLLLPTGRPLAEGCHLPR